MAAQSGELCAHCLGTVSLNKVMSPGEQFGLPGLVWKVQIGELLLAPR